jgi:hypothetical protein
MDYTQRTNKLAHHVALSESERTAGGPAAALAEPGFCVTRWESGPQVFPQGRLPVRGVRPLEMCRAWKSLTGDAGWAGVLAEGAISRPPRTATVIFSPGQEMLPLVVEALALVPPQKRWEVTFSTYFTRLPAGLECQWRFVLAGSAEANAARANPHALVIDLTRASGQASGGRLVEAARTGLLPEAEVARQAPAAATTQNVPAEGFAVTAPHQTSSAASRETQERVYALRDRDEPKSVDIGFKAVARTAPSAPPPKSSALKWTLFAAAALIATIGLFGGGTAAVYYFFGEHPVPRSQPVVADPIKTPPKETPKTPDQPQKPAVVKNNPPAKSEAVASRHVPRDPPPRVPPRSDPKLPKPVEQPAPIAMVPKPEPDPFEAIKKRNKLLRLPPLPDFGSSTARQKLVHLSVSDPKGLQWRLLGAHQVFDDKTEFEITPVPPSTKTDSPTWAVNGHFPTSLGAQEVHVGTLILKSSELQYSWAADVHRRADINKLRYCLLEISYGPEKKVVMQFDPQNTAVDDIKLSTGSSMHKTVGVLENVRLDKSDRPPLENLLVKVRNLKVARLPEGVTIKSSEVNPLSLHGSKSATFRFVESKGSRAEPGQPLLELQIALFEVTDADIKISVTLNGFSRPDPLVLTSKDESPTKFDERVFAGEKKKNESELKRCRKELKEVEGHRVPSREEHDLRLEIKRREENKQWFDRVWALYSALKNSTTLSFELCLPIEDGLPEVLVLKSHGSEGDHTSARNGGM